MLTGLPPQRVTARNTSARSANQIHDDAAARRLGFRGGLVPGVTVYAYTTRAVLAALGPEWLARGWASVRFVKPLYDGEEVLLTAAASASDPDALEVRALNPAGETCAIAAAGLAARPAPVDLARYPARPLPAARPPATRAVLEALGALGSPERLYDEAVAAECRKKFDDEAPLYRGAGAAVHPAFLLEQANRAIDLNVALGPWIHAASEVRHLGPARLGDRLSTRGWVARLFEKKGNELAELDLLVVAGAARPVAGVRHSVIYRLRTP